MIKSFEMTPIMRFGTDLLMKMLYAGMPMGPLKLLSVRGRKSGKEIYRVTVLFRAIPFKKGEKVEYQGEKYKVKLLGKDILLQDLKTGKKVHVKYKEMAEKSLDFISENMIDDKGAYHYFKEDGTKGVTGSLLDNSYLLLAFVEGYEVLGNEKYLEIAKKAADFSLDNLYDWNSGGFFTWHQGILP